MDIVVSSDFEPKLSMPMRYHGMGHWLKALLGAVVDAGAGPYTHTFGMASPDTCPSLTAELIRGDSGVSEVGCGLIVSKGTLNIPARNIATLEVECVGKTTAARAAAGVPTDGDLVELLGSQVASGGSVSWNGHLYPCLTLKIVVDRSVSKREFLGSLYTTRPMATGMTKIEIQATVDADDALYTAYRAGTSADLTFSSAGTGNDAMAVTAENCVIMDYNDDIKDQSITEATVTWEARVDAGGTGGFSIVLTNDDALWDTN